VDVAIVTGANTGIGLAIAERLLANGYALGYTTAGNDEQHEGPYEDLRRRYGDERIHWVFGDLSDPAVPVRLVDEVAKALGAPRLLVNNAGLSTAKPFFELTVDDFETTFSVDVRASFLLAQAAASRMKDAGGGCIVNITSVHQLIPRPGFSIYAPAKAALGMLGRALALELAEHGIRVVNVAPGVIATPRNEEDAEQLDPQVPLGRPGKPDEVAALVAWLASDEAGYVTGSTYVLDGGMTQQVVDVPAHS
jgi:NAD(P)-dependent dehydrogenase (short-subunit alcohol dehydrogenase family)